MSDPLFPHLAGILEDACRLYPTKGALIAGEHRTSFLELASRAWGMAAFFEGIGIGKGDVVALCLGNGEGFVVAHYALVSLGAVVAPINPQLGDGQIAYMLELIEAKCLVLGNTGSVGQRAVRPPSMSSLVRLKERDAAGGPIRVRLHREGSDEEAQDPWRSVDEFGGEPPAVSLHSQDPAVIFFTSGTTGRPKAIRLTHGQALAGIEAWMCRWQFDSETICIMAAPFFHVVYNPLIIGPHTRGGTSVVLNELSARAGAREVERLHATALMGNPSFFLFLLNDRALAGCDLASLKTVIFGAAPAPIPVVTGLKQLLPQAGRYNCYGLTETASAVSCLGPEDMLGREDSVGKPHPGVKISIRDPQFRALPPGQVGEVCVSGPNVICGYLRAPEADAERFVGEYLRTGDVGFIDAEGFLYLLGRNDDLINVAGEKIYPREIEEVLFRCSDVLEAAVMGQAHPKRGQIVRAFVAPRPGSEIDVQELRRLSIRYLPAFAVPKSFTVLERLPRNPSGKIDNRKLQETDRRPMDHE